MAHCKSKAKVPAPLKKGAIQTEVHRNVELPPHCGAAVRMGECCCEHGRISHQADSSSLKQFEVPSGSKNDRYSTPQLNSTLKYVKEMEKLEALRPPKYRTTDDLTPRSKATIAPKITQKLNIDRDKVVFKNLTPINVNDSILIPKEATSIQKKFTKTANKAPTPELCDFLDPLPGLELEVCEPEVTLEFSDHSIEPFQMYLRLLQ